MLNRRSATVAMGFVSAALFAISAHAGPCGQTESALQRLQEQAAAYAAGMAYVRGATMLAIGSGADVCAESADEATQREIEQAEILHTQAEAYALGDTRGAQRLATVEGRGQPNRGYSLWHNAVAATPE